MKSLLRCVAILFVAFFVHETMRAQESQKSEQVVTFAVHRLVDAPSSLFVSDSPFSRFSGKITLSFDDGLLAENTQVDPSWSRSSFDLQTLPSLDLHQQPQQRIRVTITD